MRIAILFVIFIFTCALGGALSAADSPAAPGSGWKAGIARVAITPQEPLWLAGYGGRDRPANEKIHDLWIKVLALEDARGSRAIAVTGDVLGFPRVLYEHLASEIERRFGLGRAQVLLAASHTHSGPVLRDSLLPCYPLDDAMLARIEAYSDALEEKILGAAGEAIAKLEPARLLAGEGRAGFAVNRRANREADVPRLLAENAPLAGPVDHTVPVLAVRAQDGRLAALLFGYACHCTNLDTYLWCGDYAGFAQIAIEKAHAGATAMFWAGCGADQNPLPRRSLPLCEMYGTMLAAAVEEVLRVPMRPLAPRLRTASASATLAYEKNPTREDLDAAARSSNPVRARWALRMRKIIDAGGTFETTYPYPVTAWRLGDQLWIHLGGEAVVDYALLYRREFGSASWIAAFANDCMGYIPSRRVWEEGGYEGGALFEYDLPADRWTSDVEERVSEAVGRAVREATSIARVEKKLYLAHPRAGAAALVSTAYVGPDLERMEVRGVEARDDLPSEIGIRFSNDNGRTWSESVPRPDALTIRSGIEVREHEGCVFFDPVAGVLAGAWLRQIARDGLWHNFTYVRLSRDHGRTWTAPVQLRYEDGKEFDPANPIDPAFLARNQAYFGSSFIRHSNGTLLFAVAHANAPDDPDNDRRPWRMGSVIFIGRWDPDRKDYAWTAGGRATISPDISSRGLMEPDLAELRDGRVLIIWRGSNTSKTPGRKWWSVSADGGKTLAEVRELTYDDGARFYSPSSYHRLIRHTVTGRLYWIGNISRVPPRGNWPRYPLIIAEVDEERLALRRSTVTIIDDRSRGEDEEVQFSNFSLIEDRETHAFELILTLYGADPSNVFNADAYRYTVTLGEAAP